MSVRAKREYLRAIHARYQQAARQAKGQILDEFCATTGSALRLLHGPHSEPVPVHRRLRRGGQIRARGPEPRAHPR